MCNTVRPLLGVDAVSRLRQRLAAILKSDDKDLRSEIEKLASDASK